MRLDTRSVPVFLTLSAAYLSAVLLRWLRWILLYVPFQTQGAYGWTRPHPLGLVHLFLMVLAPVWLLIGLLYVVSRRYVVQLSHLVLLAILLYLVTLVIDLDMTWFTISQRHIGATEIHIFLFENLRQYADLPASYEARIVRRAAVHLLVYGAFVALSVWMPDLNRIVPNKLRNHALALIWLFAVTDIVWTNYYIATGNRQVAALSAADPLRTDWSDGIFTFLSARTGVLGDVNRAFLAATPNLGAARENPLAEVLQPGSAAGANVIVLAVEGFNFNYFDQLTALNPIKSTSIIGANHFSTGDATHLGMLGISHGTPVFFYGSARKAQSKYIDLFGNSGYRTRRFGAEVTEFAQIEDYSRNFSLPTAEPPNDDDWAMLDDLRRYITADGKYVAIVYYFGTHWPYRHASRYVRFQPEVPPDFDYSRWDLRNFRVPIVNRYKNSLDELNDWLEHLLPSVDLDKTVLVIVGDHGEELLEDGRLTHSGGLWERQIRTPLLIHAPRSSATRLSSVTSHANILPAVAAAVGALGDPSAADRATASEQGYAIAAHNNHTSKPTEWVFVRGSYKILFGLDDHGQFIIRGVTDRSDRSVLAAGLLVDPAFLEALGVMKGAQQISVGTADVMTP